MFNKIICKYLEDINNDDIHEIYAKVYFKWILIRKNEELLLDNFNMVFCKNKKSIFNLFYTQVYPNPSLKIITKYKIIKLKRKWFGYKEPKISNNLIKNLL